MLIRDDVEEFWAIALNSTKDVIAYDCLFRGTADCCLIHPRDIFRFALKHNAISLLVAHNHPSGNPEPSENDIRITHQLVQAGLIMQIPVLDHIIVGDGDLWVSMLDRGFMVGERELVELKTGVADGKL